MRHRKKTGVLRLGRTASHRDSMLRNLVTSFFEHERIKTTDRKAKALQPLAESMISLARRGDLHARRLVLREIRRKEVVTKLFDDIAKRYPETKGGYTRIIKAGFRHGDNASMSIVELTVLSEDQKKKEAASKQEQVKSG
jgi:large subunit ribosomal protein L17